MTTTDCATELTLPASQGEDVSNEAAQPSAGGVSRTLKGLLLGFGITVTVGLTLASWYVGVRILSADEVSTPASPVAVQALKPAPVAATQFYLQVAGNGAEQDSGFVKSLEANGFHAQVQDVQLGSKGDSARILIGPFSTHTGLEQAQRKLQGSGVLAVETTP